MRTDRADNPVARPRSTELMRRLKRFQMADYACLIVKYANDNRYSESADICTHDRQTLSAVSATSLQQIAVDADTKDVVGIDEGQFVRFRSLARFVLQLGYCGFDGDCVKRRFAYITRLIVILFKFNPMLDRENGFIKFKNIHIDFSFPISVVF